MKITICGSIAFFDEMIEIKEQLEKLGHTALIPPTQIPDDTGNLISVKKYYQIRKNMENIPDNSWVWERKKFAIKAHFDKIENSEAILVLNYTKSGTENYIGANTFLEMGIALHLNKKIFLLNNIPELSCKEELLGMKPKIINKNLTLIK